MRSTADLSRVAVTVPLAGALATVAFDLFGQGLSPLAGFAQLAPVGLAQASIKALTGIGSKPLAEVLHVLTGVLAYPLGYLLVARPVAARLVPWLHWSAVAAAYGVGLWVFALYVMAHLVAGNAPFLGFQGITWVALWGHVFYALVAAFAIERRLPRTAPAAAAGPAPA